MASDRTAELFDAVYANLDDDGARLVLADHLSQLGDPRGELIALQCTAAPTPEQRVRAEHLLAHHGLRWLREGGLEVMASRYERGFPVAVELTIDQKSEGAPAWRTIREVVLVNQQFVAPSGVRERSRDPQPERSHAPVPHQPTRDPALRGPELSRQGSFVWPAHRWELFPALRRLALTHARDLPALCAFLKDHPLELASPHGIVATWP